MIKKVTELGISNGEIMLYQTPYFTLKNKRRHPYVRINFLMAKSKAYYFSKK